MWDDELDDYEDPPNVLMAPSEHRILEMIAREGVVVSPEDIHEDMREFTLQEEEYYLARLVEDIFRSRLFRKGYFDYQRPKYLPGRDTFVICAELTGLGYEAYRAQQQGLFWDIEEGEPAFAASYEHHERDMICASFEGCEARYKIIEALPHRIYDDLRERIPAERCRQWKRVLSDSADPNANYWFALRFTHLPGVEGLRERWKEFHVAAYLRWIARATSRIAPQLEEGRISSDSEYDVVRAAREKRMIECWIDAVQRITRPDDALFAEVENLSDTYHLVKAEAFLQKMKCWTPLDHKGRRT